MPDRDFPSPNDSSRPPLQFSLCSAMVATAVVAAVFGALRYAGAPTAVLTTLLAVGAIGAVAAVALIVVVNRMDDEG